MLAAQGIFSPDRSPSPLKATSLPLLLRTPGIVPVGSEPAGGYCLTPRETTQVAGVGGRAAKQHLNKPFCCVSDNNAYQPKHALIRGMDKEDEAHIHM